MKRAFTCAGLALGFVLSGCGDDEIQVGRGLATTVRPPAAPLDAGPEETNDAPTYRDEDFVEADTNRDPFRNFAQIFQLRPDLTGDMVGRDVEMANTSVEEMRVIGIISGVANPRAMIVDREGVGHTVSRGQYIGRSEVVQAGTAEDLSVTLNWRIERIRPSEVVLTREDPTAPNRPALTRTLPLREAEEETALGGVRAIDDEPAPR